MNERSTVRGALHRAVLLLLLPAILLAACGASTPAFTAIPGGALTPPPMGERDTVYNPARPAPELKLTDQDGKPFDLASLRGTIVLVYFGYTHCPDICPTTLVDLRTAVQQFGKPVKVVFVTVDPARDTAPAIKTYLDAYKAGFIGLTGTDAQIAAAAKAWGVGYRAEPADSLGNYPMTHTTESYLVDASGQLRNHIFFGAPSDLVVKLLTTAAGG
ncbi:MAG: SCO family protein [Chloroflexota bacterium]